MNLKLMFWNEVSSELYDEWLLNKTYIRNQSYPKIHSEIATSLNLPPLHSYSFNTINQNLPCQYKFDYY